MSKPTYTTNLLTMSMTVNLRSMLRDDEPIGDGVPRAAAEWCEALERRGYMLALADAQALSDDPKAPLSDEMRDGVLWAAGHLQGVVRGG